MKPTNQLAADAVANVTDIEGEIDDPSVKANLGQVIFDLEKVFVRTHRILSRLMTEREFVLMMDKVRR